MQGTNASQPECGCCKRRRTCAVAKPAQQFFPSRFTTDGLTVTCRSCVFNAARDDRQARAARGGA